MRRCLAKRHLPALSPIHPEILKAGPNHTLAIASVGLKKPDAAAEAFKAALADDPQSRPVRFDYAMFHAGRGEAVESLKLLHQIVGENSGDLKAWGAGGQIALERPELAEFARDWMGEAIKVFPENRDIILLQAQALLLNGDAEGALVFWRKAHSGNLPRQIAALVLCEVVATGCSRTFIAAEERVISHEFLKWYQLLVQTGANSLLYQLHEKMDSLRRVLPSFVTTWEAAVGDVEQSISA
jgi:tetratricopeptide (TPR) repeat protein